MSGFVNVCWWLAFTCTGIVVEMLIPRIDALVPGMIVLLQERSYRTLAWLLPLFVLLQEGLGTQAFGASIVWYTLLYLFFRLGERFFTSDTAVFVFFLSSACGAAYYGLHVLMAPLQDLEINNQELIDVSLVQAVYLPLAWTLCRHMRREVRANDE